MPYRDRATVESWLNEYIDTYPDIETSVSVLDRDFTAGPDSGLVVVSLRHASTVTYIQATERDGIPVWMVTFEAREDSFDLDAEGVARLAHDLGTIARICHFLQQKTDSALAERRVFES